MERTHRLDSIAHRLRSAVLRSEILDLPLRSAADALQEFVRILRRDDTRDDAERCEIESAIEEHRPGTRMVPQTARPGDSPSCSRVGVFELIGAVGEERRVPIDVEPPLLDRDEQKEGGRSGSQLSDATEVAS